MCVEPGHELRRLRSVSTDLPDALRRHRARAVDDPLSVGRRRRILRIDAVVRELPRVAAVRQGDPDLEVARSVRAPEKLFAVMREHRIPILRVVVSEPARSPVAVDVSHRSRLLPRVAENTSHLPSGE
jgi:hypothetical protein